MNNYKSNRNKYLIIKKVIEIKNPLINKSIDYKYTFIKY